MAENGNEKLANNSTGFTEAGTIPNSAILDFPFLISFFQFRFLCCCEFSGYL
jgi:hypothetical protein